MSGFVWGTDYWVMIDRLSDCQQDPSGECVPGGSIG